MNAQSSPSDSLVFECDFDEPPEKVWRALTQPRLLEAWLTLEEPARAAIARPPQPADYEILTAEPHRLVRYRWRDRERDPERDRESGVGHFSDREVHSIVTVELAPGITGGTHLRLTHGEFRIVSAVASLAVARVTPIVRARRRTIPILSFAGRTSWRRAA